MNDRGGPTGQIQVALYKLRALTIHASNVPQPGRFLVRWGVGLFTRLGDTELAQIAGAFGLGGIARAQPILAGTINTNFAVDTERGSYFVRLNEGKSLADVAWEAQLVAALAAAGVVTPPPILAEDGRPYALLAGTDKWVSVFPWRAGRHLGSDEITAAVAGEFGAALAGLHVAGLALPEAWRRASIYDHDHLVARHASFAHSRDPELARAIEVLGEELAAAAAAAAIRRRATHGIIHGDLFRDNVLWDEAGRIAAILDFEQASGGSLVYDLAICLNDWCWTGAPRLELAAALLAGYQRVRPLTAADREAFPVEVRAASARFTITRITDVYLARVYNPDKDFRAFLARCDVWRGPALGQLSALL
ncbi:MAG TPA: homoserine kinase [Kofleriaceae bacterium]|nr:homoserine kinase [Kofleriaceae bacterium]